MLHDVTREFEIIPASRVDDVDGLWRSGIRFELLKHLSFALAEENIPSKWRSDEKLRESLSTASSSAPRNRDKDM